MEGKNADTLVMETKSCGMCKQQKPLDAFAFRWKAKGTRQANCRECHKLYRKEHYNRNRQKYIQKAHNSRNSYRKEFFEWLSEQSCTDCGFDDMRTLEFDHVRGQKEFNVSTGLDAVSKARLWAEIAKCEIVCANCHRIRTAERGDFYRYLQDDEQRE